MMCLSFGLNYFIGITKSRVFCLFYVSRNFTSSHHADVTCPNLGNAKIRDGALDFEFHKEPA